MAFLPSRSPSLALAFPEAKEQLLHELSEGIRLSVGAANYLNHLRAGRGEALFGCRNRFLIATPGRSSSSVALLFRNKLDFGGIEPESLEGFVDQIAYAIIFLGVGGALQHDRACSGTS